MKRLSYADIEDFTYDFCKEFEDLCEKKECVDFTILAKYKEAREIIQKLTQHDYQLYEIDLSNEFDYIREYIIGVIKTFGGVEVFCSPMIQDGEYLDIYSDFVYIFDDCSSVCLKHITEGIPIEVSLRNENECDCNIDCPWYDECQLSRRKRKKADESDLVIENATESEYVSRNDDGKPIGFTKAWLKSENGTNVYSSVSHFSSELEELCDLAEKFGVKL